MDLAQQRRAHERAVPAPVVLTLGLVALVASAVTIVGSDALWLPALGDYIRDTGSIPVGIPFAAAPSTDWVNTTVLGQLILSVAYSGGSLGIVVAQVVAVVTTLTILAAESNARQPRPIATVLALVAVAVGAVAPLCIARAQLLSLVPFAVLVVLLRRQHDQPTRGIWWAVPLIALWGNLHGAVLAGVAVLGCYLVFSRLRSSPVTAVSVGLASLVATCLNPGLLRGPRYYFGVFTGQAASDDSGMWSRLSLANPFDVLLILASLVLVAAALRQRRSLWEYAAGVGLLVATFSAARHGVWLLLFLMIPAAAGMTKNSVGAEHTRQPSRRLVAAAVVACFVGSTALMIVRAPSFRAADEQSTRIAEMTRGEAVLATEPLAESLAAAGATVWMSNPLDAFIPADQTAYLAFMKGDAVGARSALLSADVVVTLPRTAQSRAALLGGYAPTATVGPYIVMRRA